MHISKRGLTLNVCQYNSEIPFPFSLFPVNNIDTWNQGQWKHQHHHKFWWLELEFQKCLRANFDSLSDFNSYQGSMETQVLYPSSTLSVLMSHWNKLIYIECRDIKIGLPTRLSVLDNVYWINIMVLFLKLKIIFWKFKLSYIFWIDHFQTRPKALQMW